MPIIDRFKDMGTVVMGKVESGSVSEGDSLVVMPNKVICFPCPSHSVFSIFNGIIIQLSPSSWVWEENSSFVIFFEFVSFLKVWRLGCNCLNS